MANTLITPSIIAKEALMQLENNLVMGNLVHRAYRNEFVKVGSSISIRKPVKFTVGTSADISSSINDVKESTVTFTVDRQRNVSWLFSSSDLTLTIEEYSERYIKPACIALANQVDAALCGLYKDVFNAAGTAGTTPNSYASLGAAAQKLDEFAVPRDNRRLVLNPAANWSMADALKGLHMPNDVRGFVRKGLLGEIADMEIYMDQNIYTHTKGVATGTPLVCQASECGGSGSATYVTANVTDSTSTLYTDGWTAGTTGILKAGDIITIAGVYAVNPVNKQSTGSLQQFVVTADADSGASTGPAALTVSPAIVTSGAYQTVTAAPANNAAITVVGSHAANLAFHKNAFGLVTVPLELPDGAAFKARETYKGLSIRVIKDYNITTDQETIRLDILFGVKCIYPELACRLLG